MFISKVFKSNKLSDKKYAYYRLMHSYRIGNKTRHQFLLSLGTLENVPVEKHKFLADRIEQIVMGEVHLFATDVQVEELAQQYAQKIIEQKKIVVNKTIVKQEISETKKETDFELVDINSLETDNVREIGGEWLAKQAIEQVGLDTFLQAQKIPDILYKSALISIISRMIHPASELETERWLKQNSGVNQLFGLQEDEVSRYYLSNSVEFLYKNKTIIENFLYKQVSGLFGIESNIVIYDLTNIFFEGRKLGSKYCKFGRSKEKRSDCRLICVALQIDNFGFIRSSHFYAGNQSEPATLAEVVEDMKTRSGSTTQLPVIVMDAGIATEKNLAGLRGKYDYVCVSRSKLKKYEVIESEAIFVKDKRDNKIELKKVTHEGKLDHFVYVKSAQKQAKEESMEEKLTDKYETELKELKNGLQKKHAHRKMKDVYERMGRLKERHPRVSGCYEISYIEDKKRGLVTDIEWSLKTTKKEFDGTYFLRYSNPNLTTTQIWDTYNTIREVEETFRTLKTDLQIRPIHHQKDEMIMAHIFIGLIGYQLVNMIRYSLKKHDILWCWKTLVNKMNTYKSMKTEMLTKEGKRIIVKYCSRANGEVRDIFEKLKYKIIPFRKQKIVVT